MEPRPFAQRIEAGALWTALAFRMGRGRLALLVALAAGLAYAAGAFLSAPLQEPDRVRNTFDNFISGLITAATIAVGFATLSLRRALQGIGEISEHVRADREYSERVALVTGERHPPIGVGAMLAAVLDAVARRAAEKREQGIARHVRDVAGRLRRAGGEPDALIEAALDLDTDVLLHEARERVRDEALVDALECADIGRSYVKTLGMQWGLNRMSQGIALSSLAAVLAAAGVVVAYEAGPFAPVVLGMAFFLVVLPLAVFVSFALRFTFLNQHTLPIGHFVLGPEDPDAVAQR